jgi:hypothetical protein
VKKGKGKEKEREKLVRTKPVRKAVKSVAFIEDEDSSSSGDKPPPATRPKPRPAYHGTSSLEGSVPESRERQKDNSAPAPLAIPVVPPHAASSSRSGHAKPGFERAAQTPAIPAVTAGEETHSIPVAPAIPIHGVVPAASDAQYLPHGPPPPLHAYAADEHSRYYHGRPPVRAPDMYSAHSPVLYQNSGPPRFSGDGEGPPERYGFPGDYYGYAPPPREYYPPQYPHSMQPSGQPPYVARPPASYHHHTLHNPQLQSDAPRGPMGNAMASSSRLSPSDHAKST